MDELARRWQAMWQALSLPPPPGLMEELMRRYQEPQRHYHTLQHLSECLLLAEQMRDHAARWAEIELALWFHDAVYDVRAHDNEAASAQLARERLPDALLSERIAELVMATRHDALPQGADARLLVDIDLAILAAPPARFAQYEQQIRAEYAHVPEPEFNLRRTAVMRAFAARFPLFLTVAMRARLEDQARANLSRYIS